VNLQFSINQKISTKIFSFSPNLELHNSKTKGDNLIMLAYQLLSPSSKQVPSPPFSVS
jgi:hypothetical protein